MTTAITEDTSYIANKIYRTDHDGLLSLGSALRLLTRDERLNSYRVRFCNTEYKAVLIYFPKGKKIKYHMHKTKNKYGPRPLFKILLTGHITYQDGKEDFNPLEVATVQENVFYNGEVLEDSLMMLLSPTDSDLKKSPIFNLNKKGHLTTISIFLMRWEVSIA